MIDYTCDDGFKFVDGQTTRRMKCLVASVNGVQQNGEGAWNNENIQASEDADVTCRSESC